MIDIVCMGELLIDFTSRDVGVKLEQAYTFDKHPGGAPANVAAGCVSLGGEAGLITRVGDDSFGRFLVNTIRDAGVDDGGIIVDENFATQLAFVSIDREGSPDFEFHVIDPAHENIAVDDVHRAMIEDALVFHFGSLTLRAEPSRTATLTAVEWAADAGVLISYDPNYRENLWPDPEDAYEMMADAVELCDIVKMNDEELKLLTGTEDAYTGLKAIIDMGPELAAVTFGEDGCAYAGAEDFGEIEGLDVNAIDTTGCGDAFVAATLTRLVQADKDITELGGNELREIYQFANAAAAFAATGNGAIPAMPSADEVETMLKSGL